MNPPPEHRGYVETRLTLLPTAEGGREIPIETGYMPNVWLPGSPERLLASAMVELVDRDELAPGGQAITRLYPFAPEIWGEVVVGAELDVTEGPQRLIGRAVVTRIAFAGVFAGR